MINSSSYRGCPIPAAIAETIPTSNTRGNDLTIGDLIIDDLAIYGLILSRTGGVRCPVVAATAPVFTMHLFEKTKTTNNNNTTHTTH